MHHSSPNLEQENEQKGKNLFNERSGLIISYIGISVIIFSIFIFLLFGNWTKSFVLDESKMGQFGDFIGGIVGTLFAFAGVILYYVALTEQRKDIKINQDALGLQIKALNQQIDEFHAQKIELEMTRKIYEQQNKTMKTQQFDSNFYSMLNVYLVVKNSLNSEHDYFFKNINKIKQSIDIVEGDNISICHEKIIDQYTDMYLVDEGKLSHFFKTFHRLIKIVDDSESLNQEEKIFYSKIIRSQVTDSESLLLYYHLHSIHGTKTNRYALKYDLLKYLNKISKIEFEKMYPISNEKQKVALILFNQWLSEFINANLKRARDIDGETDIKTVLKYEKYDIIIGIYIDIEISIKVIVSKNMIHLLPFAPTIFSEYFYSFLLDEFRYSKFSKSENIKVLLSIDDSEAEIKYNFTIKTD